MSAIPVRVLVEPEGHLPPANEDWPFDEVRLLHHQINRFLLRSRQRPLLEYRAPRAHEIEKTIRVYVLLEKRPCRRVPVDVPLFDIDLVLLQKTSGVAAGGSGRFPEERRLRHAGILPGRAAILLQVQ
jgi:hypothetical protein